MHHKVSLLQGQVTVLEFWKDEKLFRKVGSDSTPEDGAINLTP
jgi:hypothetical protein